MRTTTAVLSRLVGDPVNVAEAAIRGVGKAAELIDLTKHTGAHPRLGAADVIPFIPIEGITLEDCVAIARRVGEEIWKRYHVPVYLYEAAAQRPERQNLENIRRGQFEGIREDIKTNAERKPDFGEAALHPTAGATVVGARKFLVAYNVYLNTPDVEIAKKIGKAVRFSNGGLRYVKGMGVGVRGLAQVSMNLTDTDQTPIARVYEYVKREAARYGVMPLSSEIVGLIPKKALEDAAEWFLQIENFDSSLILENRLAGVMSGKMAVGRPAGGRRTVRRPVGSANRCTRRRECISRGRGDGCGLGGMVAGMSRGKKAFVQYELQLSEAIRRLAEIREELKAAIDADADFVSTKSWRRSRNSRTAHGPTRSRFGAEKGNNYSAHCCGTQQGIAHNPGDVASDYESENGFGYHRGNRSGECCDRRRTGQRRDQSRRPGR